MEVAPRYKLLTLLPLLTVSDEGEQGDEGDKGTSGVRWLRGLTLTGLMWLLYILWYVLNTMGIGYMALWGYGAKCWTGWSGWSDLSRLGRGVKIQIKYTLRVPLVQSPTENCVHVWWDHSLDINYSKHLPELPCCLKPTQTGDGLWIICNDKIQIGCTALLIYFISEVRVGIKALRSKERRNDYDQHATFTAPQGQTLSLSKYSMCFDLSLFVLLVPNVFFCFLYCKYLGNKDFKKRSLSRQVWSK